MNLLFEIAPEDPRRGKKRKRAKAAPAAVEAPPPLVVPLLRTLGTTGDHSCGRCQAEYADIIDYDRRDSLVACAFCGQMEWVRLPPRPAAAEWVFPLGIHEGKTVAEAFAVDPEYVQWAATQSPSETFRDRCRSWLDSQNVRF